MGLLSVGLSLVYILAGGKKLFDFTQGNQHSLSEFTEFAKVFPLGPLGYTPDPGHYMVAVGVVEVSLGLALILGATTTKRLACKGLMVLMAGATQTLLAQGKWAMAPIPATFFLGLFVVHRSLDPRQQVKAS